MKWRLHHVGLSARLVAETAEWYADVLGMEEVPAVFKDRDRGIFFTDDENVRWFDDDSVQLHVARPTCNFAVDNDFFVDPLINGHVAIEVDDLALVRKRLREADVYYADAGNFALQGYEQLYFLDPAANAVEVNMRVDD